MNRNYEYEKYQTDYESRAYLRGLLRTTVGAIEALSEVESMEDLESQQEFKEKVNELSKFYYFKFSKSDDVDMPSELQDQNLDGPKDLTGEDTEICKKVFYRVQELQEDLGHTGLETMKRGRREVG